MASNNSGIRIGFNFVPFPQAIWDDAIYLSQGGFLLLGYLIRHTVGFGRDQIKLSDDELINGRKKRDGSRLDQGCGLRSVNGIKKARTELLALNWIVLETDESDKARTRRYYSVNLQSHDVTPTCHDVTDEVKNSNNTASQNDTQLSQNDTRSNKIDTNKKDKEEEERKRIQLVTNKPPAQDTRNEAPPLVSTDLSAEDLPVKSIDAFQLTPNRIKWAKEKAPEVDIELATERFRVHFKNKKTAVPDWAVRWQEWILDTYARLKESNRARPAPTPLATPPPADPEYIAEYKRRLAAQPNRKVK